MLLYMTESCRVAGKCLFLYAQTNQMIFPYAIGVNAVNRKESC